MAKDHLLIFDHGTSGLKACVLRRDGQFASCHQAPLPTRYPQPGWVEQDPMALWEATLPAAEVALGEAGITWGEVQAIAMANQRETTILWDRDTGKPLHPAIVWQCRRTEALCNQLIQEGWEESIHQKTGLRLDPYFSGTKARWILDHVPEAVTLRNQGRLLFGTVDTWILWQLSGKKLHLTDPTNASRTLLYDIHQRIWDGDLTSLFGLSLDSLPEVRGSGEIAGDSLSSLTGGVAIPLGTGVGDQQAALFGQGCWEAGQAKSTYGTGTFVMMNLGLRPTVSEAPGLLTTLAAGTSQEAPFALEGAVFVSGGTLSWLRDSLGVIQSPAEADSLATSVADTGGVYLVPAFVGLGAPHWQSSARGLICGLTQASNKAHLARAALESVAYQTKEVLDVMTRSAGLRIDALQVDGGVTQSAFFVQFLADILQTPIHCLDSVDITAKGAGYLTGLSAGFWSNKEAIKGLERKRSEVLPRMTPVQAHQLYEGWEEAVGRCLKPLIAP